MYASHPIFIQSINQSNQSNLQKWYLSPPKAHLPMPKHLPCQVSKSPFIKKKTFLRRRRMNEMQKRRMKKKTPHNENPCPVEKRILYRKREKSRVRLESSNRQIKNSKKPFQPKPEPNKPSKKTVILGTYSLPFQRLLSPFLPPMVPFPVYPTLQQVKFPNPMPQLRQENAVQNTTTVKLNKGGISVLRITKKYKNKN